MNQQAPLKVDGTKVEIMSVGNFLRQKRIDAGLTQKDVADRSGIGLSTVKQYESGRSQPTIEKAVLLGQTLQFEAKDLFDEVALDGVEAPASVGNSADNAQPLKPPQIAWEGLERVRETVARRGAHARFLPTVVRETDVGLNQLNVEQLTQIADEVGLFDDAPGLREVLIGVAGSDSSKACDCLQDLLIVHAVHGESYQSLETEELEKLHGRLAAALNKSLPLKDVPQTHFMDGFFNDEKASAKFRLNLVVCLAIHLAQSIRDGSAKVSLEASDEEDGAGTGSFFD